MDQEWRLDPETASAVSYSLARKEEQGQGEGDLGSLELEDSEMG